MPTTCRGGSGAFACQRIISHLLSERGRTLMPTAGGVHAALHLFLRDVLYMGGHPPVVPAHVLDAAPAVAVELVLRLCYRRSAGGHGAGVGSVDILQVELQGGWHSLPLIARLAKHNHGVAYSHFGVADGAIGHGHSEILLRVEGGFQKVDEFAGAFHYKVRRDGVIPLGDWFDWNCFGWSAHG